MVSNAGRCAFCGRRRCRRGARRSMGCGFIAKTNCSARTTCRARGYSSSSATAPCVALGSGILLRSTSSIPGLVPPASLQSFTVSGRAGLHVWTDPPRAMATAMLFARRILHLTPAGLARKLAPGEFFGRSVHLFYPSRPDSGTPHEICGSEPRAEFVSQESAPSSRSGSWLICTSTVSSGAAPGGPVKVPATGGTASGWRCTATGI